MTDRRGTPSEPPTALDPHSMRRVGGARVSISKRAWVLPLPLEAPEALAAPEVAPLPGPAPAQTTLPYPLPLDLELEPDPELEDPGPSAIDRTIVPGATASAVGEPIEPVPDSFSGRPSGMGPYEGWVLNISRGGVRLVLDGSLLVGQVCMVHVGDEEGDDEAFQRRARVVWAHQEIDGVVAGLQFIDARPANWRTPMPPAVLVESNAPSGDGEGGSSSAG
jgi:hypothetical protein